MKLSLFIRNKEFHISCGDFAHIYKVTESREMADNIPLFLKDALDSVNFEQCDEIIYSSGPASFTTARIMNSLIKGLAISRPDLKFTGISNFLTYLHIASQTLSDGILAIPTMRGDYFTVVFKNGELGDLELFNEFDSDVILDTDKKFDNVNLAYIQMNIVNIKIVKINDKYIQSTLDINYGFTPKYRATAS